MNPDDYSPVNGVLTCTSAKPVPEVLRSRFSVAHPEAKWQDSNSDYFDYYYCPACGESFKIELPE